MKYALSFSTTATPGARYTRWPGTGRQRRCAEPHGAQKSLDVPGWCVLGWLRKRLWHDVAVERVAEHRAHEHRDRDFDVGVGVAQSLLAQMLDVERERRPRRVRSLARGARRVGTFLGLRRSEERRVGKGCRS